MSEHFYDLEPLPTDPAELKAIADSHRKQRVEILKYHLTLDMAALAIAGGFFAESLHNHSGIGEVVTAVAAGVIAVKHIVGVMALGVHCIEEGSAERQLLNIEADQTPGP